MISVIIPTYNAINYLPTLLPSLQSQTIPYELIIIDSSSTDGTPDYLRKQNIPFVSIDARSFNHGATRNYGVSLSKADDVLFLTQDALPTSPDSLEKLSKSLYRTERIALAYGRQLPYPDADVMSQFARLTNYPDTSTLKTLDDIPVMGIKTCHCSNSFAAYKREVLLEVGGFPTDTILGEDVTVAARMLHAGKHIYYCADATVYHSHNYTIQEEFKRYFDIGTFHQQQKTILQPFTKAESEGVKYVLQEWTYLKDRNQLHMIPQQLTRTIAKYIGYKVGFWNEKLPLSLRRKLSMHASFWR